MKKKSFLIATLLVVMATAVAVVSCKKEKQDQNSNGSEQTVQNSDNMDEYLISFKKKLLSAEKGDETITLEQAERDLGNLLNFDFGDANYATDVFQHDTLHAKLTLTADGQVDLSQLAVTYGNVIDGIIETYHGVSLPEKSVYGITCRFNETESKEGELRDVEIVVITRGLTNGNNFFYDPLDWKPQNEAGTCDGQHYGYGAPEIIERWIRDAQNHMECENGGRIYYTDCGNWNISGYQTYDSQNDCFKIYTDIDPNHNTNCVTHEEMVYYFNNILAYWNNAGFPSHEIFFVRIDYVNVSHAYVNGQLMQFFHCWLVRIEHRKPNCSGTNPLV